MNSGLGMVFLRELLPFVSEGGTRATKRGIWTYPRDISWEVYGKVLL
jgi:hypothetical protein